MIRALLPFLLLLSFSTTQAASRNFLNEVIFGAPPKMFADLSFKDRQAFLLLISRDDQMLDYANGWMCYFSDNPYTKPQPSCAFYVKLLPRSDGSPLALVFLQKDDLTKQRIFILKGRGRDWEDVSAQYIPADLRQHAFVPRRNTNEIQVVPYVSSEHGPSMGKVSTVLRWTGKDFTRHAIKPVEFEFE